MTRDAIMFTVGGLVGGSIGLCIAFTYIVIVGAIG